MRIHNHTSIFQAYRNVVDVVQTFAHMRIDMREDICVRVVDGVAACVLHTPDVHM